jgi:hypothetical protein
MITKLKDEKYSDRGLFNDLRPSGNHMYHMF